MGATSLEELNCPARLAGEWLIPVLPNEESLKKNQFSSIAAAVGTWLQTNLETSSIKSV